MKNSKDILGWSLVGIAGALLYKSFNDKDDKKKEQDELSFPEEEYRALVRYALSVNENQYSSAFFATVSKLTGIQSYIQYEVNKECDKVFMRNLYNKDAFRHIYWSALMTRFVSEKYALTIGNAHENGDPNNHPLDRIMDEWNNAVGRGIAIDNPDENLDVIKALALHSINMGIAKILRPKKDYEQKVISYLRKQYSGKVLNAKTSIQVLTNFYKLLYKNKEELILVSGSKDYREYNYKQIQQLLGVIFVLPLSMWKNDERE